MSRTAAAAAYLLHLPLIQTLCWLIAREASALLDYTHDHRSDHP